MNDENNRKTWKQSWSYREGTIITSAILLLGFAIQAGSGTVLKIAAFPWNLVSGGIFLIFLVSTYFIWHKKPLIKFLGSVKSALPAILGFTFLVLLMGFVKQDVEPKSALSRLFGLTQLVHTWPFILINVYLMILLGIVTLKRLSPLSLKNAGFFLNHFGLFLVLFSTSLGSSDMQRVSMNCYENQSEQNAVDSSGKSMAMPFSIKLLQFSIDEFRPKVAVVDTRTGAIIPYKGRPLLELLDKDSFKLGDFQIKVEQFLESSGKQGESFVVWNEAGSAPSAEVIVKNMTINNEVTGWISCGSFVNPGQSLKLDDHFSLAMLPPEPRKFSSELNIQTQSGKNITTIIEVNRPYHLDGWTIYQLGYNTEMGRWSNLSVLELVRDPWLPVVYFGIFLMMAGAVFLFVTGKPKDGGTEYVA